MQQIIICFISCVLLFNFRFIDWVKNKIQCIVIQNVLNTGKYLIHLYKVLVV